MCASARGLRRLLGNLPLAVALAREAEAYHRLYKEIRPHEHLDSKPLETGIYLSFVIHARFPST